MGKSLKAVRIVLASADDVQAERELVDKVVRDLKVFADLMGLSLSLIRWERVAPDYDAAGTQAVIDDEFQISTSDIFIDYFGRNSELPPSMRSIPLSKREKQGSNRK